MRIVIDGTLGSGKTTFLSGTSPAEPDRRYPSIADLGYPVFAELIRGTVDERLKKTSNPFDDWDDFFRIAIERAEDQYLAGAGHSYAFYDRGLPFLGVMAGRYGVPLPQRYYDACESLRYDDPVFVFLPVESIDYGSPRPGEIRASTFSLEERISQHDQTVEAYGALGYQIELVPILDPDKERCILRRLEFVKREVGL